MADWIRSYTTRTHQTWRAAEIPPHIVEAYRRGNHSEVDEWFCSNGALAHESIELLDNDDLDYEPADEGDFTGGPYPYVVRWEIVVDGASAADAAQRALTIARDPESTATVFLVRPAATDDSTYDDEDDWEEVDLLGQ